MKLNFTLAELCASSTAKKLGLSNAPDVTVCDNLMLLIINVLQPLRTALEKPVIVSSGYRNPILNSYLGSKANSQHVKGQAADISVIGMSIDNLFDFIKKTNIEYDQLIHEGTWIHISYSKDHNRKENLKLVNGKFVKV